MTKREILRRTLLSSVGTAVMMTGLSIAPANAQLDEIIVTAQKREENIQKVPISVSAIQGERYTALFQAGDDIRALATRIPSFYAESSNGRAAPRFYIRGLGNTDFDLAASQPISVIQDDVVLENVILKSSPIFDIEQVEVLRGPQGTLFGRNTPAGIVKFTSVKPSHETDAYATLSGGELGTFTAEGAVGGSILGDVLSARISGLFQRRGDWIDNSFTRQDKALGGFRDFAGRVQVLYEPNESWSALLNVHGRSLKGNSASVFRANIVGPGNNDLNANFDRDTVAFNQGDNNPQQYDGWGASLNMSWDLNGVTITSITAYETTHGSSLGDIDGGNDDMDGGTPGSPGTIPFQSVTQDGINDLDQFTQEVRIANDDSERFRWQFGGYYFDGEFTIETRPFSIFFPASTILTHENQAWAVFGQAAYDILDTTTITAGVRFTDDEKDLTAQTGATAPVNVSDDQISWDVSLNHFLTDDVNLYARVASGFRAPTIQGRDVAFGGAPSTANSETIMSYEGGIKSELFDRRARVNFGGFYYKVEDLQVSAVGGAGNFIQLVNAEEAVGWGFELDTEASITENLLVTLGVSYNNTEIQDGNLAVNTCAQCTVTDPTFTVPAVPAPLTLARVDGNPLPQAPRVIVSATARYGVPMGDDGELFFFTDWAYQGKTNLFLYESAEFSEITGFEGGLKIGYAKNDGSWEAAIFARNITDEEILKGGIDFNNNTGFVNEPRVIGVSLTGRL